MLKPTEQIILCQMVVHGAHIIFRATLRDNWNLIQKYRDMDRNFQPMRKGDLRRNPQKLGCFA